MESTFRLSDINAKILECLSASSIGLEPIKALMLEDTFVPKEGLLWDYKEQISADAQALAKTVLQIVSFYNICGGYLIYGIKETIKDKEFIPVEVDLSKIKPAQIRDKIKYYTNEYIDFTFGDITISFKGREHTLGIIHIPKRPRAKNPVAFIKNGPEKKNNTLLFEIDQTYFRHLDECLPATKPSDWQTLFSEREFHPIYGMNATLSIDDKPIQLITHDLPDKNLICSNFIGRTEALSKLWEWLADDLEYTKILSGDGGKGKTSIAYEFCRTFVRSAPQGYERIVWLSVKQKQFSGINNEFYDLNESDFTDSISFLKCLGEHCAQEVTEYETLSIKQIKRNLSSVLDIFPTLYVVDDIDSLEEDEQRKVVDYCRQLGSEHVRFLITTRKKFGYSSDLCVDIDGLPLPDFSSYIDSLVEKYSLKNINAKDKTSLHVASDGSPLLSASILRLFKLGIPLQKAITEWKGSAGEDARNAALLREIKSLSQESKRLLLTIFYFKSCSFTELKQASGLEKIKLVDCLEELQSLFLVNEPKIIDSEQRFSISNTTSLIVSEIREELAFDYKKLDDIVRKMKTGPVSKKSGNRRKIGLAINQAVALLKDDRVTEAIETVDNELREMKENPDLLLMKGRCLLNTDKPNYEQIRELFRTSHKNGQSKNLLFELWFQTEQKLNSSNGIIEVAQKALDSEDIDTNRWYERLARGYVLRANNRSSDTNKSNDSEIKDLMDASLALTRSLVGLDKSSKEMRIEELNSLHDVIWKKLENSSFFSWLSSFDILHDLILRGDTRTSMYLALDRCLVEAKQEHPQTKKKKEAISICGEKLYHLLESRSDKDKLDRPFLDIKKNLGELDT
ncbi:ATP-binding protein [Vibrio vulnificus]|uniref:ATP-binding protein n=1 Tax=Vibrio vulnificus TaxID=672 RepID=UPI001D85F01B|nr:ATP-binding protein [Vibrio cholerae]EKO3465735.1 ATP-binding protein [Vibrio fluvialis]